MEMMVVIDLIVSNLKICKVNLFVPDWNVREEVKF